MAQTTTENFLGKCKEDGCDYVIFATGADVQNAENFRDVRPGAGVYRVGNYGRFARCTSNHKVFPVKAVKGTYSPDHQCDSRCLNAKGWSCTCSCGGANHGRGHVATVVTASELSSEREAAHLGIVGKHVTGRVIVKSARKLAGFGSTLYTFEAENTDKLYTLKWFAPEYADPEFDLGSTLTIRAKVKSHGEFNGAPETVVIYVEEVK